MDGILVCPLPLEAISMCLFCLRINPGLCDSVCVIRVRVSFQIKIGFFIACQFYKIDSNKYGLVVQDYRYILVFKIERNFQIDNILMKFDVWISDLIVSILYTNICCFDTIQPIVYRPSDILLLIVELELLMDQSCSILIWQV